MPHPQIRIHDLATNTVIDREMTDFEHDQYLADKALDAALELANANVAADKAELLTKLGITAEEAKLLLS